MNPAAQANDRLGQLISISQNMEKHLSAIEKKDNAKTTEGKSSPDNNKNLVAIGGLATSMSLLINSADKLKASTAENLSNFIKKLGESIDDLIKRGIDKPGTEKVLESISIIATSSSGYLKEMAKGAILGPIALVGTMFFGANMRLLFAILENAQISDDTQSSLTTILSLSGGIIKFGLSMSAYTILGPIALTGAIIFGATVKLLFSILESTSSLDPDIFNNLSVMSKSIIFISLPLVLLSLAKKQFIDGAITFYRGVSLLTGVFRNLAADLPKTKNAAQTMLAMALSITLFSATMAGISLVAAPFAIGILTFALGISAMVLILTTIVGSRKITDMGLNQLGDIMRGSLFFVISMTAIGLVAAPFAFGTLVFITAVSAVLLTFGLLSAMVKGIEVGTLAFKKITTTSIKFALVMVAIGIFAKPFAIGALALSLGSIAVGSSLALIGLLDKTGFVTSGANTLARIALPTAIFAASAIAISLLIKESPQQFLEKMAVVGIAIGVMGAAAAILGIPVFAAAATTGAGVMIILGASLLIISGALWVLSKVDLKSIDGDKFKSIITSLAEGYVIAGKNTIAIVLGSAAIIAAGIGMIAIMPALGLFKLLKWNKNDSSGLELAVGSVISSVKNAFTGLSISDFGKIFVGVGLMAALGGSLVSLAFGMKAISSLTFTEMEWDESSKKLIPRREVKLQKSDFKAAGDNITAIFDSLTDPLIKFGKKSEDGTLFGLGVGNGYLQKGIDTARTIGNAISNIAKGVVDMANLTVTEWTVVNAGTKDAKLVPNLSRKLSNADFLNAAANVSIILNTLTQPLLDFGMNTEKGSGIFSGGYMEKGISAAKGVGDFIANIADGVLKMSQGEILTNIIINGGTADAKLVPDKIIKLNEGHYKAAAANVGILLNALAIPLVEFGKSAKDGNGIFENGYIESATDSIGKIGGPLAAMADMVIKMASGSITENEIVGGKSVPVRIISFQDALNMAKTNISVLLTTLPEQLVKFGKYIDENKKNFESAQEGSPILEKTMMGIAGATESYKSVAQNILSARKLGIKIDDELISMSSAVNKISGSFEKLDGDKVGYFKDIVGGLTDLSKIANPFEKFMNSFGKFQLNMEKFVNNWELFGSDNASYMKTFTESVNTLSKIDSSKLRDLTSALYDQSVSQQKIVTESKNNQTFDTPVTDQTKDKVQGTKQTGEVINKQTNDKPQQVNTVSADNLEGKSIANLHVTNLYIKNDRTNRS